MGDLEGFGQFIKIRTITYNTIPWDCWTPRLLANYLDHELSFVIREVNDLTLMISQSQEEPRVAPIEMIASVFPLIFRAVFVTGGIHSGIFGGRNDEGEKNYRAVFFTTPDQKFRALILCAFTDED